MYSKCQKLEISWDFETSCDLRLLVPEVIFLVDMTLFYGCKLWPRICRHAHNYERKSFVYWSSWPKIAHETNNFGHNLQPYIVLIGSPWLVQKRPILLYPRVVKWARRISRLCGVEYMSTVPYSTCCRMCDKNSQSSVLSDRNVNRASQGWKWCKTHLENTWIMVGNFVASLGGKFRCVPFWHRWLIDLYQDFSWRTLWKSWVIRKINKTDSPCCGSRREVWYNNEFTDQREHK